MPSKSKDYKYTDPELRNEVKEEIQAGDKGGTPGQWSARKAQMVASEYKKSGGGYTTDKKDESAEHLDNWTEEEWQRKEGSGHAKQQDGTEKRYLPQKVWDQIGEKEKEETDQKKQEESKKGKQHVANTSEAKNARKNANKDNDDADAKTLNGTKDVNDCAQHWEDHYSRSGSKEYQKFKKDLQNEAASESGFTHGDDQEQPTPKKRGRGANQKGTNKKQKTGGSSKQPHGTAGDKTRVPKVGQKVEWHDLSGYVDGEVVEVVYEQKTVEGILVMASKEDPRIVLKSSSSGKIAVHEPKAVYFD